MKSISLQSVITSISSKADRSLSLRIATPELSTQERALFMELQNIAIELTITPKEEDSVPEYKIDKDLGQKTQAQRIRSIIFLLFKQNNEGIDNFEEFYRIKTEKYINQLKSLIED